jgi:predicted DNA-binding transcriptional regulator YafY
MFPGEPVKVEIWFDASMIGVVIDRFGTDAFISSNDEMGFTVSVDATISPAFLAWLIQFGDKAKILSPESVKGDLMKLLDKIIFLYKK